MDRKDKSKIQELVNKALAIKERAHVPYSGFHVGAALLTENGQVFAGCNVENASYGLSICAERNAIFQAIAAGEHRFKAIAIASDADEYCVPCGACRQVLWEFAKEIPVIQADSNGEYIIRDIKELLPGAFPVKPLWG